MLATMRAAPIASAGAIPARGMSVRLLRRLSQRR
jgi:hypothetical protein